MNSLAIEKKVNLKIQIQKKQKDMYKKAKDHGLTHPLVVSISQELDTLLNRYQEIHRINQVS